MDNLFPLLPFLLMAIVAIISKAAEKKVLPKSSEHATQTRREMEMQDPYFPSEIFYPSEPSSMEPPSIETVAESAPTPVSRTPISELAIKQNEEQKKYETTLQSIETPRSPLLADFDLQKAIVYTQVLEPKFKEYE